MELLQDYLDNSGNQIAFYRVDQSMVTNYPLVNYYDASKYGS
ncbi:MAG: hypothetical protein R3B93_13620 [Bacteroidia bacterium]